MKTMYFFTIKLRKTKRLLTKIMNDVILLLGNNIKEMVLCRGKMMLELRVWEKMRRIAEMSLKTF